MIPESGDIRIALLGSSAEIKDKVSVGNVNGFDFRRLAMLLAVLEKRMELVMGMKDVFINLVGGLKVDDPAADLSILCAIASSFMDKPIDENIVFIKNVHSRCAFKSERFW